MDIPKGNYNNILSTVTVVRIANNQQKHNI